MQDGGSTVLWAALISGGVALLGALGSQGLAAWVSIRSKKLGLAYKNKAQAYAELLAVVGEFALDPKNPEKYLRYLGAYEGALLFASDEVAVTLTDSTGVSVSGQRLRSAQDARQLEAAQAGVWYDGIARAAKAMRADLSGYI